MKLKNIIYTLGMLALLLLPFQQAGYAQSLNDFEENVTEFTLDNGLTFIVVERPVAPVVSMASYVNVGSANEPVGHTGMAHIFEHMAFKGTSDIGTTNWEKEQPLLKKVDETYQKWLAEKYSVEPDSARMEKLWTEFKDLEENAGQYVKNNEYSQIIDRNGGTGLGAATFFDWTRYEYSLPENRIELWFSLESNRFTNPVFREFYKEKEVIREERRMRVESNPSGRLLEEFMAVAYTAHPYGRPIGGWHSDIIATTKEDAREFYNTYYVPNNITITIAGDVNPQNIKTMAETYFGDMEAAPEPPPVYTKEPDQRGERRFTIQGQSQPLILMGYHAVPQGHPDYNALQLLGNVLLGGRTSKLYKSLVEDQKIALGFLSYIGGLGTKYEPMFAFLGAPNQGKSIDSLETAIYEQIDKIKNGNITQEDLDRVRTNQRASLVRSLDSNAGLARKLASAEALRGDWKKIFTDIDKFQQVTVADIQRVANKYLTKDNRTVGIITNKQNSEEVADANQ